ncbi:MAG TPA: tRNA 2-thiouridine(34) synthase MnmA [Steroidobacteraceae bacterium]|nr:tRNA 2-thiouridine(34) synthase MnmA [Steroidobacteraceae bacterium]
MDRKSASRIVVGLSGGVDSAVAALLLKEQGFEVHGLYMSNWDDEDAYCTAAQDFQDARSIARELAIPLHRVSFAAEYRARVFEHFLAEHRAGRTPNPDVLCNREVKFGVALRYAERLGAQRFATGHYARLLPAADGVELHLARDAAKDQTYFLHAVTRSALERALMPLGESTKSEVRARARSAGLPVHDKPDSTGICFIGERPFRDFLARFLPSEPGPIESSEGTLLGSHPGLAFYTLGQRAGLAIGGRRGAAEAPWYVAAKDRARNALIVVQGHEHPLLKHTELVTEPFAWLAEPPERARRCTVRVRHRQAPQPALIEPRMSRAVRIVFDEPQRAMTPGQYAVVYEGTRCLGGGVIEAVAPDILCAAARGEHRRRAS